MKTVDTGHNRRRVKFDNSVGTQNESNSTGKSSLMCVAHGTPSKGRSESSPDLLSVVASDLVLAEAHQQYI